MKFLKNFALGLLWAFLSPLLALVLVLFAVYSLFVYLVECFKCLIRFFQGKSFFPPLEEDLLVKKIQEKELRDLIGEEAEKKEEAGAPAPSSAPQQVYVQQNFYSGQPGMPFPGMPFPNPQVAPLSGVPGLEGTTPLLSQGPDKASAPEAEKAPEPISVEAKEGDKQE